MANISSNSIVNEEKLEIERLVASGHTRHCACRIVWGDGCCECGQHNNADRRQQVLVKLPELLKKA